MTERCNIEPAVQCMPKKLEWKQYMEVEHTLFFLLGFQRWAGLFPWSMDTTEKTACVYLSK
jgi:hypothetical protein